VRWMKTIDPICSDPGRQGLKAKMATVYLGGLSQLLLDDWVSLSKQAIHYAKNGADARHPTFYCSDPILQMFLRLVNAVVPTCSNTILPILATPSLIAMYLQVISDALHPTSSDLGYNRKSADWLLIS
jgi:hypothetical protein